MDYSAKEKLTMKDIVLETIKEISKKALVEFKGGESRHIDHGTWHEEVYIPDTRKEYIQGVEFLSDLILSGFDKTMKEDLKSINEKINDLLKKYEDKKIDKEEYVIEKLKLTRILFQRIMICLERTKYFKKKVVYG